MSPRPREWPLVGRDAEFRVASDAVAAGHGVVLAGVAGVGKTRLAVALGDAFERDDEVVRLVATRSAASLPLGAFGPLLPANAAADVLTLNAVVDDVRARHVNARLVLLVDDAHLLDEASAALLHRLVAEKIAIAIVTIRTAEPAPDAVVALWKDELCDRIELQPLSADEVERLTEEVLGGVVDDAVPQRLWHITRGNALWLRELMTAALDDGALVQRRDTWVWARSPRVTGALRDLLASRLAELDPDDLDALALLTVAEALPLDVFVRLRGIDSAERLAHFELIETSDDPPWVRVAHPLFSEIVRGQTSAPTRTRLSRELALAYPEPLADPSAELQRIVWQLDGGVASDADLLLRSSRSAQLHNLALATRLARAAVDAGGGVTASLRLADLLANGRRLDEAYAVLEAIDDDGLDDRARIRVASVRASTLLWFLGRPGDARRVIEQAESRLRDPALARELMATRVQAAMQEGCFDEVARLAGIVLDDEEASNEVKAGVLLAGVPAWLLTGDLETTIARCESAREIVQRTTNAFPVRDLLFFGSIAARLYLGELDDAEREFTRLRREEAASESDVQLRFFFSQGLGRVEMLRGRIRSAVRYFQEAASLIEEAQDLVSWNLGLLAHAHAVGGDPDAAAASLADAESVTSSAMLLPDRGRARAAIAHARGEHSRAVREALGAADCALEQGQRVAALFCAHDAVRWGAKNDALERVVQAAKPIPGGLAPAIMADAAARVDQDARALAEASEALERLGCFGYAADAAATAASWLSTDGHKGEAARLGERVHALAGQTDDTSVDPAVLQAIAQLTAREREVATMAALGRSDKEIAAALGVSFRTVETHLHRAYAKLGVASRYGLAEIMSTYVIER
jgi:ATP/maltotriose-dependent transcriptional regulator MalT